MNLNWNQWNNNVGSVLALDLSKDLGLSELEAPSLLSKSTLQITANFTNTNLNSINYVMYVLICEEGTFTISNSHAIKSIGVLTSENILEAQNAEIIPYRHDRNIYGGAWYDDLWSGIKDAANYAVNNADKLIPIAEKALPLLGLGADEMPQNARNLAIVNKDYYDGAGDSGGRRRHLRRGAGETGGVLVGGRKLRRSDM